MVNLDQSVLNWVFGIAGALATFVLNALWDANKQMRIDLAALNEKIGREYVRRDDYREDIGEIKAGIVRIYDKLEEKADRP